MSVIISWWNGLGFEVKVKKYDQYVLKAPVGAMKGERVT